MTSARVKKAFGARLQAKRRAMNLTGNEFAELIGSSPNYVSQLENGSKLPSINFLINLTNIMQCGIDELFCDELNVMQPCILNEITQEIERHNLRAEQIHEINIVVRAMLSYMTNDDKKNG